MHIVVWIISVYIGILVGINLFHRPVKIEFKVSMISSFLQAVMMFLMITIVMAVELSINQWQLETYKTEIWYICLISELIDSGILVVIISPLLSMLFGKWIRNFDLDICNIYSEKVIKIYYSLVALTNCVWYMYVLGPYITSHNPEIHNILNRVFMWMLNVLGTWVGIGFHCKGRINEEVENIQKSKEPIRWKEILKYSIPFVVAYFFTLCLFIIEVSGNEMLKKGFNECYIIVICVLGGMIISMIICKGIYLPSERISNIRLRKALRHIITRQCVNSRYQNVAYTFLREEKNKYIIIHNREVIWIGHKEEVEEIFKQRKIQVENFEYKICKELLMEVVKTRKEFIRNGFDICKEDTKRKLVAKKEKNLY